MRYWCLGMQSQRDYLLNCLRRWLGKDIILFCMSTGDWSKGFETSAEFGLLSCCFTSTEAIRLVRDGSPGRLPRLSQSSWTLKLVKSFAWFIKHPPHFGLVRVQELCECRGGRPGLSVLMNLTVSVDVKQHWTMLRHWSQFVPNMSTDIRGHKALHHHHLDWSSKICMAETIVSPVSASWTGHSLVSILNYEKVCYSSGLVTQDEKM